jgi:hypothetical protein
MRRVNCLTCGKPCEGEYCFLHKKRKPIPKKPPVYRGKSMQNFFLQIWEKRKHYSEISGTYLGKTPLTVFFHHILPKSKYPQAELDEENIILLTLEEHDNVEMDIYRYEEVNKRRESLIKKYERTQQGTEAGD